MLGAMNKVPVERWREIIRAQQVGGLSVTAFCRRARVPQSSFFAWRRKLRDAVTFAEVQVAPEPACDPCGIELCLPGRRSVIVRPGFDRHTLLVLLAALEAGDGRSAPGEAGG
jgi:hypothetical protein